MPLRIANAAGFLGDNLDAPRLVESAEVDYLTIEHLAELTLSILARLRKNPAEGLHRLSRHPVRCSPLPTVAAQCHHQRGDEPFLCRSGRSSPAGLGDFHRRRHRRRPAAAAGGVAAAGCEFRISIPASRFLLSAFRFPRRFRQCLPRARPITRLVVTPDCHHRSRGGRFAHPWPRGTQVQWDDWNKLAAAA